MGISSLGVRTTNGTIAQACWELRTPAGSSPRVLEISYITLATAQSIGLGRPTAQGVTPVTTPFQPDDIPDGSGGSSGSSAVLVALSWATSPPVPATFIRRWNTLNTFGMGVIWTFPRGLFVPASSSLVIWNITATAGADVTCIIDE
jgi:hypothetical protein